MDWLYATFLSICAVVSWVLIYRAEKRKTDKYHMEMIEAQKEIAETIGTVIADAIKSGMSAEK